jgi:hypothetical protein
MRPALLAASTLVLATLAVFACSSEETPSTPTDTDAGGGGGGGRTPPRDNEPPDDNSSGGTSSNGGTSGGSSGGTSGGTSGGGSSSGDGGTSSSGGNPGFDAGVPVDGGAAGSLCLSGSIQESEDNGTEATANQMPSESATFCGRISAAGDVDFIKFMLPANATSLSMRQNTTNGAATQIEAFADGEAFSFSGTYPFKPGKPYVLKISSKNGNTFDYRIMVMIGK